MLATIKNLIYYFNYNFFFVLRMVGILSSRFSFVL